MLVGMFHVKYEGSTVSIWAKAGDAISFENLLQEGDKLRQYFKRTEPGSDWGCDGVGYGIQKNALEVELHRSGVGPMNFRKGVERYKKEVLVKYNEAPDATADNVPYAGE